MKRYQVKIRGVSPYSQSRHHDEPALEKEAKDDYERRTWRSRMHTKESGEVDAVRFRVVPPRSDEVEAQQGKVLLG
jgi:hypothetical protein